MSDDVVIVLEIDINPGRKTPPDADGAGEFVVLVAGRPEENEYLVYHTVESLAQQIGFPHGQVHIQAGLITATRIPENPEEEKEIGDAPHLVKLAFEELPRFMPSFDPAQMTRTSSDPSSIELLRQFNVAKEIRSEVERFVALFKILEKAYGSGPTMNLSLNFRKSTAFIQLVHDVVVIRNAAGMRKSEPEIHRFIQKLIQVRNSCAHFKANTGYSPCDSRIATEVRPLLEVIQALAMECVARHVYPEGRPEAQRGPF